jgi:hypothetical protein
LDPEPAESGLPPHNLGADRRRSPAAGSGRDNVPVNETAARQVLLVRAVESADSARTLLSETDRQHAARAATELARWAASERGEAASAELFVERRAELLAGKLAEREPRLAQAVEAFAWRPWIGVLLPLAALVLGAFVQQVGDRQHINVLAFPLLSIIVWNVVVYAALALHLVAGTRGGARRSSRLRRAVVNSARRGGSRLRGAAGASFAAFMDEWSRASAGLLMARGGRVLHLAAACIALGAIAGMYVRGLVFEYRAGWESTFLDATQVHAILSILLAPAARALAMPFPGVNEIAAIQWPASGGESAARWIHWYALTVAALVVGPRLVLAVTARWREQRLSQRFPVGLDEPYFRRLLGGFAVHPVRLRVVPYSYTVDEAGVRGLETVAKGILGDNAELALRPPVAFGAEASYTAGIDAADRTTALSVALFTLAATPEHENHGAFLENLRRALAPRLIALVDEAPYRRRLGDAPAAGERLAERRGAWSAFGTAHGVTVAFADLSAPDVARLERDLQPLLAAGR